MSEHWYNDPEARAWLDRAHEDLLPKVTDADTTIAIYSGEVDPKMAIEMGYMVMLDKPIIALIKPGVKVPRKLAMVVDRFIEGDMDDPDIRQKIAEAIFELDGKDDG